jgi:hypothetical protein
MYTAYLFTTDDLHLACNDFLHEQFKSDEENGIIRKVLDIMNPEEFMQDYLLKEEYLDGEIIQESNKIGFFIKKDIRKFDLKDVEVEVDLKKPESIPKYLLNSIYENAYEETNELVDAYKELAAFMA